MLPWICGLCDDEHYALLNMTKFGLLERNLKLTSRQKKLRAICMFKIGKSLRGSSIFLSQDLHVIMFCSVPQRTEKVTGLTPTEADLL